MVQNYAHAMYAFFGAGEFAADFVRPSFFGKTQPSQHRHCQSNFCFTKKNSQAVPILYSQFQKRLREHICLTGRDGNLFSSHSFRRGGCSWAFRSNVESELIQHHGDWLSSIYTEYLTYDFDQKLSVSRKMANRILNEV